MTKFQERAIQILASKEFAKKVKLYRTNKECDVKEIKSQFLDFLMQVLTRLAIAHLRGELQGGCLRWDVNLAALLLDEQNLACFVEKVGIAINRRGTKPLHDPITHTILKFWDGFDTEQIASDPRLRALRTHPPLSRWSGPATCEFVNWALPRELHITYRTYLRRVERLPLKSKKPILVTKIKSDAARKQLSITLSPAGREWIATQTSKKMSHDVVMTLLFNAADESGKGEQGEKRCVGSR